MAESSLFSAFRSSRDGEQSGSGRSREQLEQIVESLRQRAAGDPKHACEIVKQGIRESQAGPRLVARIVEAVAMEVPEQMRLVSQCATTNARTRPMVWTSRRLGGQVAVRLGDHKVIRQGLNTGQPGPWEVYDLARDQGEGTNLASGRPELVEQAIGVLKGELGPGAAVPVSRVGR